MNPVRLALMVSMGFLVLSALTAVTVGKAMQAHLDPQDPLAPPDLRVCPVSTVSQAPRALRDRKDQSDRPALHVVRDSTSKR